MAVRAVIFKEATPEQLGWRARIARNEKPLMAAFLAWVERLQAQLGDSQIVQAITTRSLAVVEHVLQMVVFQPVLAPVAEDEAIRAFRDVQLQNGSGGFGLHLSFDLHDPNFDRAVREHEARLVREVTTETRRAIASVIERGYASGQHPYVIAPQIRELVGLTSRQANAVMNFAEAQRRQGRSPQVVADRAMRYAGRMRTRRAQTVARTETARAAVTGRLASYEQAAARGLFDRATAELEWSAVQDDPKEVCAELDGKRVPFGESFDGLLPPAHPNCRCAVHLVVPSPVTRPTLTLVKEWHFDPDQPRGEHGKWVSGGGIGREIGRAIHGAERATHGGGDQVSVGPPPSLPADALKKISDLGLAGDVQMGPAAKALYGTGKSTEDLHKVDGKWTTERARLHEQIIASHFAGKDTVPVRSKMAFFTAGGGASGKSAATFLVDGKEVSLKELDQRPDVVAIDPDRIKMMLPEYKELRDKGDPYAASGVHEESSALAKAVTAEAQRRGLSILVDTTGSSRSFVGKLKDAQKQGYAVQVTMFSIPTNEAIMRSLSRGERSGRYVSINPLKAAHAGSSRELANWKNDPAVSSWRVYDNSAASPALVAKGGGGESSFVYDSATFDAILAKAKEAGE